MTAERFFICANIIIVLGLCTTINQYLCLLEVLKIRRDQALEKYLRLLERASAPTAARIDPDGLPKAKNYRNSHEDILIKVADAAAAEGERIGKEAVSV